jgi:Uma2 family endonuclease
MVALRKPPPDRMTVSEFLNWAPDDPTVHSWQLIDGEPVAMAPAAENHARIQSALIARLSNHLSAQGRGCDVLTTPGIVPRGLSDRNYRIPDIGVTCAPSSGGQLMPHPLGLIEILSPTNEAETWANVWTYLTIPSVMEVLVISSTRVEAELLRRNPDGTWPEVPTPIGAGDNSPSTASVSPTHWPRFTEPQPWRSQKETRHE